MIRRLLPLVGVFFVLLTPAQHVTAATGELNYNAYSWSAEPSAETLCASGNLTSLVLEWDSQAIPGCPGDNFYLDITGQLYSPGPDTQYALYSDDGARVTIDGQLMTSNWWDRGCDGYVNDWQLSEGWHDIQIEYYENGGGTCLWLYQVTSNGWSEIPAAYLNAGERIAPTPRTTIAPKPQPSTTSIEPITTTSLELETTTTLYQPTESTMSPTTTATIDTSVQTSPTTPSTQPEIPATVASTSEPTTIPITTITPITSSIPEKIAETMSSDEALDVVTDAAAVAELTVDEAAAVFAAIDESTITPEEAAAIVEAVQDAPPSIREQFEEKINIFAGVYDGYVPLGSLVPVRTRRIIIITTGLLVAAPTLRRK
jgi:hypothetical protein